MKALRMIAACLVLAGVVVSQPARAIEAGDTTLLPMPSLLITAYQTKDAGKDLQYIELYNSGDEMVRLQDWTIRDVANNRTLQFTS